MPALAPDSFIAAIRDRLVAAPSGAAVAREARTKDGGASPPLPDDVRAWLAELILLHGLPLEYLLPDPALLPAESLRFFYLDANWQRRLIDGALSIGLSSSLDTLSLLATYEDILVRATDGTVGVRARLRGGRSGAATGTSDTITGFLLRSAAVSGWPGMEVSAYATTSAPPLPLLRLDRVTNDILLGLFAGLPSEVRFLEPPEGLHFGIIPSGGAATVYLRGLGHGGFAPGIQLTDPTVSATLVRRPGAAGVLDVAACVTALEGALEAKSAWSPGDPFTSAEFAIQMTRGAGLQIFRWPAVAP